MTPYMFRSAMEEVIVYINILNIFVCSLLVLLFYIVK
jgi:hypothetical protein